MDLVKVDTRRLLRISNDHTARLVHAVKTGVAATLALYVSERLQLTQGYWASISAMIVLQSSVGATVGASANRLAGTAIGATVGGLCAYVTGMSFWSFGTAGALTVWFCMAFGLRDSARLASATVALVMVTSSEGAEFSVAVYRFLEVALGIVTALVVTLVLWPSHARDGLRDAMRQTLGHLEETYESLVERYRTGATISHEAAEARVASAFRSHDELLRQASFEPGADDLAASTALIARLTRVWQSIAAMELATRGAGADTFPRRFDPELAAALGEISRVFERLSAAIASPGTTVEATALTAAVAALDEKVVMVRSAGVTLQHDLEEISRFYAFFTTVRILAKELACVTT